MRKRRTIFLYFNRSIHQFKLKSSDSLSLSISSTKDPIQAQEK
jgi:hypothetical protein